MMMNLTRISKYMCLILRHHPEIIGITLDEHGWANVDELLRGIDINMSELEFIVKTDDKQRYSFNEDNTLIRANQGHSIPVDVELEEVEPPEYLWHGTGEKYVKDISNMGLIPKSRLYVHLSSDTETALNVGIRHGTPALFRVDALKMHKDGLKFYLSKNGVWLTKHVPVEYLSGAIIDEEANK